MPLFKRRSAERLFSYAQRARVESRRPQKAHVEIRGLFPLEAAREHRQGVGDVRESGARLGRLPLARLKLGDEAAEVVAVVVRVVEDDLKLRQQAGDIGRTGRNERGFGLPKTVVDSMVGTDEAARVNAGDLTCADRVGEQVEVGSGH